MTLGSISMIERDSIVQSGNHLLPWLEALAASAVPRLSERSLAGVLNAVMTAALANGLDVVPRDHSVPDHCIVLDDPMKDTSYAIFVMDRHIDVQSWDRGKGVTVWGRVDTARRPGAKLPPGGEVTA